MGQLRSMLRAIAVTTDAGPAEVLSRVDAVMTTLATRTNATAVVLRLERTDEQARRGETTVRWSNAGHPPPLVIAPDGTVRPLSGPRADLLLGVDDSVRRREHEVVVGSGTVLVLYTDGLVERRDADLDAGMTRLQDALVDLAGHDPAGRDLHQLCDRLLARMLPDQADDDVALIALRIRS